MAKTVRMLCSHISHMPLHYTFSRSGIPEKYGFSLAVDIVNVEVPGRPYRGFKDRVPALLAGEYEFLSGLHHETYVCRARGEKRLVYLAQTQNRWDDRLVASPKIKTVKELEGKKVIVCSLRDPCVIGNLKHGLRLAGIDVETVEFHEAHEVGGVNGRLAVEAVANGKFDAAHVDIPFDLQAKKKGLNALDLPEVPVIHNTTICTTTTFAENNKELTINFLKALIETIHFFKTKKEETVDIIYENLRDKLHLGGRDEAEHLQTEWAKLLTEKPYPHPLAVWNVYDLDVGHDPKVNFIGPFEVWDTHLLRMIDDSGFIDQLYAN
ncbi:MAG: ABC transporter substrate-binding protein [Deltaproteobacteria bacterium]|nr:ABC transporter substrate-binding protein [Deltaproteobacteria bacterium]